MDTTVTSAPAQEICRDTLLEKYAKGNEASIDEVRRRVARALAQVETEERRAHWERRFLQAQNDGFIPAGRINSAAGVQLQATLINCFVQPVGDSISEEVDGRPGIYTALLEAAETMRRGGGVGYDFSSIRPKGAEVKGTRSGASPGTRSCARPTIPPSPGSCSSIASIATTTSITARRSRRPIRAPSSRCRLTAAAASARSISRATSRRPSASTPSSTSSTSRARSKWRSACSTTCLK